MLKLHLATSSCSSQTENTFVTETPLPEGALLAGRWMVVDHGNGSADEAYRMERIERRGDKTGIQLTDDPGLRMSGTTTEEVSFP